MNISRRFFLGGAVSSFACYVFANQSQHLTLANDNKVADAMSTEIGDAYKQSVNGENVSLLSFLNKEKPKLLMFMVMRLILQMNLMMHLRIM